jgi:outer membrane protein assembly factor BamD
MPLISHRLTLAVLLTASAGLAACGGGMSQYQGVPPEELFAMAEAEMAAEKYDNAVRILDRLLIAHGDWDRLPEARLLLGHAHFAQDGFLTARAEYQRFIDRYAGHPGSADASLGICKSLSSLTPRPQRDQGYTQEAMASCRNVVVDFAGQTQAAEAAQISNDLRQVLALKEFMNAEFYFRRRMYDSAILYYQFVVNLYSESEYAPEALLGIYLSNQAIGYQDLADVAKDRLLLEYPTSEAAATLTASDTGG